MRASALLPKARRPPQKTRGRDLRLKSLDGLDLAATFWPGARPDAPGLLIVHGILASRRVIQPNAEWFAAKGYAVLTIDLRGRSEMGDFMVIASGRSTRQVATIADKLAERLKHDHGVLSKMEGKEAADWVLIDTGDVIVHVFRPEVRDFYQLEKMWLPSGEVRPAQAAG